MRCSPIDTRGDRKIANSDENSLHSVTEDVHNSVYKSQWRLRVKQSCIAVCFFNNYFVYIRDTIIYKLYLRRVSASSTVAVPSAV